MNETLMPPHMYYILHPIHPFLPCHFPLFVIFFYAHPLIFQPPPPLQVIIAQPHNPASARWIKQVIELK